MHKIQKNDGESMKQEPCPKPSDTHFSDIPKEDLTDIADIFLDENIPLDERPRYLAEMLKNPYRFRVGDIAVTVEFAPDGPSLEDVFTDFLMRRNYVRK